MPLSRPHHEAAAEEEVRRALGAFGLEAGELAGLPKNDPRKIAIATVVRGGSTVTNAWLARRLEMVAPSRVSRYCGKTERGRPAMAEMLERVNAAIRKA